MAEAEEMGAPACFSEEYAFYEQRGMPLPCGGPVFPDNHPDPEYDDPDPAPRPCQGPPPRLADLGMPPRWHPHERWCWDLHARTADDDCPPPF
jgi:hypothetical protein